MKPLIPARRAAEEFAGVVDGRPGPAAGYEALADVVTLLRTHEQPRPRPEFVSDLRERLMLAAETELVGVREASTRQHANATAVRPRRRQRPLAAAAAALVFVGGTAGMAVAAQGSVPGDALYPLKRGIEQASVAVHTGDASKGADLLGQAATRLAEVRSLVADGAPAGTIDDTVQQFGATAGQGADLLFRSYQQTGDDATVEQVSTFARRQMADVRELAQAAPPQTADAFGEAAATLAGIDQQARVLCSACSGGPLAAPDVLAGPASSASLAALVEHPTAMAAAEARRARALARAAEAAGVTVARASRLSGAPSSTAAGAGSTTTAPDGATSPVAGSAGSRPVDDLVDGVTQQSGGLSNALTDTTKKLSDTTKTLTDGVGGTLDDTVNGQDPTKDLTDTVTGTVGGLLGGSGG